MPKILGIQIDNISRTEALKTALEYTKTNKQHFIVTPNPEILLEAYKTEHQATHKTSQKNNTNINFKEVLNSANLKIPDGIGLLWAAKYIKITSPSKKHQTKNLTNNIIKTWKWTYSLVAILLHPKFIKTEIQERVTGTDLIQDICANTDKKIFLLGAKQGIAEKTKKILEKKHSNIKIVGTYAGSPQEKHEKEITEKINKSQAEILFVAYGAPAQEVWIYKNLSEISNIKLAIGIGGAFDFIAGERKRAPKWMRKIGLEWLYRIIKEPSRIKRIYNAIVKFPIAVLKYHHK